LYFLFSLRALFWLVKEAKMDIKEIINICNILPENVKKEVYLWDLVVAKVFTYEVCNGA